MVDKSTDLGKLLLICFFFFLQQEPHIVTVHWVSDYLMQWLIIFGEVYIVVNFSSQAIFIFLLFYSHEHTLPYPNTNEKQPFCCSFLDWALIGHCPHRQPNNNMQVLTHGFFFCIMLYTYLDPQHSKKTLWQWWRKENKVHITSYCVLSIPACLPVQRC